MASEGNEMQEFETPVIKKAKVVIVKTEWNDAIVSILETGCIQKLQERSVDFTVITVPGAVEIPFAVQKHYDYASLKPDAYIVLGTVIKGGTPHFDYVCNIISNGVLELNLKLPVPVIFGVLTVNNRQQALDRAGGSEGHKGIEAATTAIKMIALNRALKHGSEENPQTN